MRVFRTLLQCRVEAALVIIGVSGFCGAAMASETQNYSYDELGRLTAVQYTGSVSNGQAHSLCYDPAGNRRKYRSDAAGVLADCSAPPPPTNQPPLANQDSISLAKCRIGYKNVIANDTDPEGHYPLTLTDVDQSWASVFNSTTVEVDAPATNGTYVATYTVADSLGATSTGTLTLTVSGSQQCV